MFETLKRLYEDERLNKVGLQNAINKGWITTEQYTEITGEPYTT
ncbi:XkdX family protein [Bacillus sp. 03113]|nr:XkdX family protein [Bacillus sp. 03113]